MALQQRKSDQDGAGLAGNIREEPDEDSPYNEYNKGHDRKAKFNNEEPLFNQFYQYMDFANLAENMGLGLKPSNIVNLKYLRNFLRNRRTLIKRK